MKIVVVGVGYVGLSNAVLFAQRHQVVAVDIDEDRVNQLNRRENPIADPDITQFLESRDLDLTATTSAAPHWGDAQVAVVATPTNYDPATNQFDTSTVESVVAAATAANPDLPIVVRSTIPVGFIDQLRATHDSDRILFAPEFLREGRALHDNLHPSRIVVGDTTAEAKLFAELLAEAALDEDVPMLLTGTSEAEAIKLFANTYLAMRVAYFNELDSYALVHELNARDIVEGVGLDPRIGSHYNNPSFGYGGYCLPKDTRQLLANYDVVPQNLIRAIVDANQTRKDLIADRIIAEGADTVGIHHLAMKVESDNFRDSSVLSIIRRLAARPELTVLVHEPLLDDEDEFMGCEVVADLDEFKRRSDLIVTNRFSSDLADVSDKVFTRDLFGVN